MKNLNVILLILMSCFVSHNDIFAQKSTVEYVNPFIGTGGHGHTFPGATVPFGMVQLSPDTRTEGWDAASGYHYSDSTILGFSHTHLNGTGVNDLCDVLILPTTWTIDEAIKKIESKQAFSHFQHKNEVAKAGYYKVLLDDFGITAEVTASKRYGIHRYTLPDSVNEITLIINLEHRDKVLDSDLNYNKNKHLGNLYEFEGFRHSESWAKEQKLFFVFNLFGNIVDFKKIRDGKGVIGLVRLQVFTKEVEIAVSLSSVSASNASGNILIDQLKGINIGFDSTYSKAKAEWSKYLNRIEIEGGTEDQRTIFYTALYHTLIHPSVSQDVNGDYRGLDNKVHNSKTFAYHSIFSLWDTYRALHPLYTILCPEKIPDFINGFLDDFDKAGHLPVWNFPGNETWCMIGNHSIPVIADAYLKGIKGFDAEKALNAMIKTVNRDTFGLKAYREKGYIPADTEGESVSKTLEYAYDDYCIAMMAQAMKKDNIYKEYIDRSQNWKNIFNPKTGFFQAKINETFVEPFDPREVNHHYTEGNACQYAFAVQHDILGLKNMLALTHHSFDTQLDSLFSTTSQTVGREQVDITGLIGQYAHGNEPSHHIAYLLRLKKSKKIINQILSEFYKNTPDGLIGNEDCGQMSAWYVFSAMGFYPANPCDFGYQVSNPIFDRIKIQLDSTTSLSINSKQDSTKIDRPLENININIEQGKAKQVNLFHKEENEDIYEVIQPMAHRGYVSVPFVKKGTRLFKDKQQIELANSASNSMWGKFIEIFYTTDGSNPIISGKLQTEPIEITESTTIKFVAKNLEGYSKIATATFKKIVKNKTIILKNPPAPQYSGGAADALVDGEIGTEQWQLGGWQGFEGADLEAIIDLKKEKMFNRIELRCIEDQNAWIFAPTEIQIFTSNDGLNFKEISTQKPIFKPNTEGVHIRLLGVKEKGKARYIKIVAKPLNPIAAWHKGAGGKGWILADEIIID